MDTFRRSEVSFRRQGSSGLVWQDRFFSGDLNQMKREREKQLQTAAADVDPRELRHCRSDGSVGMMGSNGNTGGGGVGIVIHRTCKVSPDVDPPSPKVSGCRFCCSGRRTR